MTMVTVPAHVSGNCLRCGMTNNATINTLIDPSAQAVLVTADASCGACSSPVQLVGDATPYHGGAE